MSDIGESKPGWTLANIAEYAGKSTSAVSNWRARFEDTFPKPISRDGVALVFDPLEVQKWLEINNHLIKTTTESDRTLIFELKRRENCVWKSVDIVREKVEPNQFFFVFSDALAHNFDLSVNKNKISLWKDFVIKESRAAKELHDVWAGPLMQDSLSRLEELYSILHLISSLTGFDRSGFEHLTSMPLSRTVAKIVDARDGQLIIDPCVGLGALLLETARSVRGNLSLYGREINSSTAITVREIFCRSGIEAVIEEGDSIRGSQLPVGDRVVAAPPINQVFSFSPSERKDIKWNYVDPGVDGGDIAWGQVVLGSMNETGIGAMISSQGILFRSGRAEAFRRQLVGRRHLEAVITLPGGLLYGTRMPCAILVFNKNQKPEVANEGVLLMNVTITEQPKLRSLINVPDELPNEVAKVILAHRNGNQIIPGSSSKFQIRCAKLRIGELAENNFNLLPTRYIKSGNRSRSQNEIKGMIKQVEMRITYLNKQLAQKRNTTQHEGLDE